MASTRLRNNFSLRGSTNSAAVRFFSGSWAGRYGRASVRGVFPDVGPDLLDGRAHGPIARGKDIDQLMLPAIPAGLPSELLERRPDIRRAEQDLIAANALIGAARAAYFPTISLTGLFGYASPSLSSLFDGPSKVWQYGAPITMPIFTAGAIAGQVQAAEAVQQQALFAYQKAIQEAFREINTCGNKAQNLEISRLVVDFKAELEKCREQVQNLE